MSQLFFVNRHLTPKRSHKLQQIISHQKEINLDKGVTWLSHIALNTFSPVSGGLYIARTMILTLHNILKVVDIETIHKLQHCIHHFPGD